MTDRDNLKPTHLAVLISLVCFSSHVWGSDYTFDPSMLDTQGQDVDVSLFNEGIQLPGNYHVTVLLNGEPIDTQDINFTLEKNAEGRPFLSPCLSVEQLSRYGVKTEDYPLLAQSGECANLSVIPGATSDFQFYRQELALLIPQVSLRPKSVGIEPESTWSDGIPAIIFNYSVNTNQQETRLSNGQGESRHSNSTYVRINPGINLGAWRFRNQTNWQKNPEHQSQWQTVYSYAERGLYHLKSRLTLGERFTPGDIFDSIPFRGVMVGSDDNMVPYNQRQFSPVVRGIARTQARVEVKQNGFTIYNETVAPGPFALTDLATTGSSGGDLQVTVWETDGQTQVFTVPYQTPAIALKEGYLKYNVMAGQYRSEDSRVHKATVGQATVMYGLPWDVTVYSGAQGAEHYQAGSVGVGVSMGNFGALSVDVIASRGQRKGKATENGSAWRARFSKDIVATNTTFTLASYRYASAKFNSLSDVLDTYHGDVSQDTWRYNENDRRKSTSTVMLSQTLGEWGSLNVSGTRSDYWNRPGHDDSWGISYGVGLPYGMTLSLGWSENKHQNQSGENKTNRLASLGLTVPLDQWLGGATYASYQLTSPSQGDDSQSLSLNGREFDDRLRWNVRQQHSSRKNNKDNSALYLDWYGTYGQVGANYSYSTHQRQMGANLSGGMLIHEKGLTISQPLGETVALIAAPGASGISVRQGSGVETDYRGYTTSSWLSPYQKNTVSLDPLNLPEDAEIIQTDINVVPTQGAVVLAQFGTRIGGRALMTLKDTSGHIIPFGALVKVIDQGGSAGIVGEKGQVYLSGLPQKGVLSVTLSSGECQVSYTLPDKMGPTGVYLMDGVCR